MPCINTHTAVLALSLLAAPVQAQVYKCPDASGRTVIQQIPCSGGKKLDVRPASGKGSTKPVALRADGKPMTNAERINAATDASARKRRMQDLSQRIVPSARSNMYGHRDRCERQIADLKAGQYQYRQNLYGKTHAAQVASEMAAVSAQCDTRDRELTSNYRNLLAECKDLGACADLQP